MIPTLIPPGQQWPRSSGLGGLMSASVFDPAHVLGCSPHEAMRLLRGRRVTPGEVESLALMHYSWRRHLRDPESYWVTVGQAAEILGLPVGEVKDLLDQHRLPHVVHTSGVRLMRRRQIRALAARSVLAGIPRQAGHAPASR